MIRSVKRWSAMALAAAVVAGMTACTGNAIPQEPTALIAPDDWPNWGRTPGEQHYSPLDEIDTGSVDELSLAWYHELPSGNTATGPVAADGKLFVTSGHSQISAFDAVSGELLWEYDSKTRERGGLHMRFGWGPKGIGYDNGRVHLATQDGLVIALDAESGEEIWKQREFEPTELRYINGPPRVFDGKVIVGHGGADLSPIRAYVTAYDAATGERLWRFHTVPGNPADGFESPAMEMAAKTWTGEWWNMGGGGTAWNAFSYDPELDYIYIGVGNGFPYNQKIRSPDGGDNLFLASMVAVKADTGEYVWHYQICPGEQWDCTAVHDMSLATLEIDGKPRKVIMQAPKNGFFYVVDRETGEFLLAEPFADKVTWAERIDPETGRPVENPGIRYNGKPGQFEMWPGVRGAHSWHPQSYSPQTGLVYIPVIEGASLIGDEGIDYSLGVKAGMGVITDPDPELPGAYRSFLKAWDPVKQEERWRIELPGNWPGGTMATAGGLVFQGTIDGRFVAYDAESGKERWSFKTEAPVIAPPISYRVNGTQYVTVITGNGAGGGGLFSTGVAKYNVDYRLPRRILTFAIGGKAALPEPMPIPKAEPLDDPDFVMDRDMMMKGGIAYGTGGCIVCHGINALPGGTAPDLRVSPFILDAEAFRQAVKEGALVPLGMPAFPEQTNEDIEAMRYYLRGVSQQLGSSESEPRFIPKAPNVNR